MTCQQHYLGNPKVTVHESIEETIRGKTVIKMRYKPCLPSFNFSGTKINIFITSFNFEIWVTPRTAVDYSSIMLLACHK